MRTVQLLAMVAGTISAPITGAYAQQRLLIVAVADRVGLGEQDFRKATQLAREIFRTAGIPTEFVNCTVVKVGPHFRSDCPATSSRVGVYVHLLPKPATDHKVEPAAAGLAMVGQPGGSGSHVYIYYNRVSRVAHFTSCATFRVLGHVMAHEIGHLSGIRHSTWGLMSPTWDKRAAREMSTAFLRFGPDEAQALRNSLRHGLGMAGLSESE